MGNLKIYQQSAKEQNKASKHWREQGKILKVGQPNFNNKNMPNLIKSKGLNNLPNKRKDISNNCYRKQNRDRNNSNNRNKECLEKLIVIGKDSRTNNLRSIRNRDNLKKSL